ncbi:DUF7345 domain-containing protein [Halobellus limi]|jgi:PGF-CTERM protein|uniref:PGF-CTERM protein n=1 Tax=Halobellus limi TaxID=699433 RepID=A0A1H5Z364_9EURY|nr:PGF-CTERM sorting domain-containing protein [Halobellus limi]QCC48233.1 PGF-CTERM sorting domain-containing protein [Halobellus limi]SEG31029.1 PGF-CTERM protein [Halobellus limi]
MDDTTRAVVGIATAFALVVSVGVAPVTAQQSAPEPALEIALHEDGSAAVTLVSTFDLTDDNESAAFEQLRDDEDARDRFRTAFAERMRSLAASAAEETGRTMSARDAELSLSTADRTGVVEMSVVWHGLAAVRDDRVVLTEPFASGFDPDRTLRVSAPEGYALTSVSPSPDGSDDERAVWAAGTDLDGFSVTASPEGEPTATDTTGSEAPGFGIAIALGAFLAAALLLVRR